MRLMVGKMGWGSDPWQTLQRRGNQLFVKLFVSVLLVGISFRLLFPDSHAFLPVSEPVGVQDEGKPLLDSQPVEKGIAVNASVSAEDFDGIEDSQTDKCDLSTGEWIPNHSGPAYTDESCPFIEAPQNCLKNGRPDKGYLYWRWKPYNCDIPPFDAKTFLDAMRNKSWALIGDSILRNHVQSLICLLSKGEIPVEVYHDKLYKSRRWQFPSHNFTLSVLWSPFIAKADVFENEDGVSTSEIQLHLDTLDPEWMNQYQKFDYIVISVGQWFLKTAVYWENNSIIGCHNCQDKNLSNVGFDYTFRKVLRLLHRFFATSDHKPLIIYRTWTPDHFEYGEWFSRGTCNRTAPYKDGEFLGRDIDHVMQKVELEEFEKAKANASGNGARLKLLDTYHLSLLRPDGHPGPYRTFHPFDKDKYAIIQNDCLHWCLPGPIDSWNDLLMDLVLNER